MIYWFEGHDLYSDSFLQTPILPCQLQTFSVKLQVLQPIVL